MSKESIYLALVGSRNFNDYVIFDKLIEQSLEKWGINPSEITMLVSGGAKGTDTLALKYSIKKDKEIKIFHPDWNKYGKSAGPIRNTEIVQTATHLIAFPSKSGRGTQDSIKKARAKNIPVDVHYID